MDTKKYHVFAPMGLLDGTTVENKGKLILTTMDIN